MAKYLVTGGAGFIGSHLCEYLAARGHEVTSIDDYSTGSEDNHVDGVKYIKACVVESGLNVEVHKCDIVIHLASAVGVKTIMDNPLDSMLCIVKGTENVLDAAAYWKKKVLIASTSEVYGKGLSVPFREDDDVLYGPTKNYRWSYAYAKALDEMMAQAYMRDFDIPVYVVRFFNTVGPRQSAHYGMVLPNFIEAAMKGETLKVHGDGQQTRCFCHVKDTVKAVYDLVNNEKAAGEIVNIGSNHEVSMLDLAMKVCQMADSQSDIELVKYESVYPQGFEDMKRRVPSIEKVYNLIKWKPTYTLEDIIKDVIKEKSYGL